MIRFEELIKEIKKEINELLEKSDDLPWYISDRQLHSIIDELDKMNEVRNYHVLYPFYPRGIVDSWDRNDSLADKLFELLEVYKRL